MDVVPVGHRCEVVSVGAETEGSKHGPLGYTACDWKICCGVAGVNERLSPVTEVGLEPVQCSAVDLSYK